MTWANIFQRDKVNKIVHQGNSLFMIQSYLKCAKRRAESESGASNRGLTAAL
jgi:hypothetical protein